MESALVNQLDACVVISLKYHLESARMRIANDHALSTSSAINRTIKKVIQTG